MGLHDINFHMEDCLLMLASHGKRSVICDSCSEEVLIIMCYIHDGITDHRTLCDHQAVKMCY
jgi:hypothetical protein